MRWTYPAHWRIHLASFGDVVRADVPELCELVSEQVVTLAPPTLRMTGIGVDDEEPDLLWTGVEGELWTVEVIAEAIPRWVKPLGFALDRRAYRPRIVVGRSAQDEPLSHLEQISSRLGEYQGRPWVADAVTLGYDTPATSGGNADFTVVRQAYFAGREPGSSA